MTESAAKRYEQAARQVFEEEASNARSTAGTNQQADDMADELAKKAEETEARETEAGQDDGEDA